MTGAKAVVTDRTMSFVFPAKLSVKYGAVIIPEVVGGVWLKLEETEVIVSRKEDIS